jgi:hypothetical protein
LRGGSAVLVDPRSTGCSIRSCNRRRLPTPSGLDARSRSTRWVLCERPVVVGGGELRLEMLDLRFDSSAGFYQAPPHVKANNGLFIVDDLRPADRRPNA